MAGLTGSRKSPRRRFAGSTKLPHWSYAVIASVLSLLRSQTYSSESLHYFISKPSIASMMVCGLELVASIFAAKFVPKRTILIERWFGGGIMGACAYRVDRLSYFVNLNFVINPNVIYSAFLSKSGAIINVRRSAHLNWKSLQSNLICHPLVFSIFTIAKNHHQSLNQP